LAIRKKKEFACECNAAERAAHCTEGEICEMTIIMLVDFFPTKISSVFLHGATRTNICITGA